MSARYEAAQMGPDDPYPGLWGIRDHGAGGEWLVVGDEPDRYPLKDLAEQAVRARQYVVGFWQAGRG